MPARSGRKRPCAVEGVGGVDHAPLAVRADGDAASHVRDDQVQLFVFPTRFAGVPACDGLLVEGVEDRFARQLGQSRNACVGNHLVHHDRIGDIGLDTDLGCDLLCDQSAQIRGVLPPGVEQVVVQCVVHLVDPALDGMNQPAAADDGRESADVKSAFCAAIRARGLSAIRTGRPIVANAAISAAEWSIASERTGCVSS